MYKSSDKTKSLWKAPAPGSIAAGGLQECAIMAFGVVACAGKLLKAYSLYRVKPIQKGVVWLDLNISQGLLGRSSRVLSRFTGTFRAAWVYTLGSPGYRRWRFTSFCIVEPPAERRPLRLSRAVSGRLSLDRPHASGIAPGHDAGDHQGARLSGCGRRGRSRPLSPN